MMILMDKSSSWTNCSQDYLSDKFPLCEAFRYSGADDKTVRRIPQTARDISGSPCVNLFYTKFEKLRIANFFSPGNMYFVKIGLLAQGGPSLPTNSSYLYRANIRHATNVREWCAAICHSCTYMYFPCDII